MSQLIPFNQLDRLRAAGLPFETEHQVRWAHRKRHETGIADAFVRLGRRWYLDPDRFHKLVRR